MFNLYREVEKFGQSHWAHNSEVAGSNPAFATMKIKFKIIFRKKKDVPKVWIGTHLQEVQLKGI